MIDNIKFLTATRLIIDAAKFLEDKYPKLSLALLDISDYLVNDNKITNDQISDYDSVKQSIEQSIEQSIDQS